MAATNIHYCPKCKHARVARRNQKCATCRRTRPASPRRAIPPIWARVLAAKAARAEFPSANGDYYTNRLVTTADILALRNKSLISANPSEFQTAADLAHAWNAFMCHQPITLPNTAVIIGGGQ